MPLWSPGAGVAVTLPLLSMRDRPARRGVGREGVGVGEAGLDVGRERDRRVLVGGERRWAGRDLEDVARVAVERDRIGAVAVGRDGDRAGVAVQGRLVGRIERLAADGESPAPRAEVDRAVRRGDRGRAGEVGRRGRAAAGERGGIGRDRVRPGGEGLAVEREGSAGTVSVIETLPVTVAV